MKHAPLLFTALLPLVLAFTGCSSTFMCHLNGTSCPNSPAETSGGGGDETASTPESTSSSQPEPEPSSSSSSDSQESQPAESDCLPSGTKTDNYHKCCAEAAKSQIEPVEGIFTCA